MTTNTQFQKEIPRRDIRGPAREIKTDFRFETSDPASVECIFHGNWTYKYFKFQNYGSILTHSPHVDPYEMEYTDEIVVQELETLHAIYPEAEIDFDSKAGSLLIPIDLINPIEVKLIEETASQEVDVISETLKLTNCSPLVFSFQLPTNYPHEAPPVISLSSEWIAGEYLDKLKDDMISLWSETQDMILFTLIDYLKSQAGDTYFAKDIIVTDRLSFEKYVAFNKSSRLKEFESTTFTCEICQEDKKGIVSTELNCGHIFCNDCLVGYFTSNIERGEVENIHCPSFECTQEYVKNRRELARKFEDAKKFNITEIERELFALPLSETFLRSMLIDQLVDRYLRLINKLAFEKYKSFSPLKVVECPRLSCKTMFIRDPDELLCICPSCKNAFCYNCKHSWHGYLNDCLITPYDLIPTTDIELWIEAGDVDNPQPEVQRRLGTKYGKKSMELAASFYTADKLFEEAIQEGQDLNKCPLCSVTIERMDGCNKMTCSMCQTAFCNLCGEILDRRDPYAHFNDFTSACYRKLFEGMINVDDQGNQVNPIAQ